MTTTATREKKQNRSSKQSERPTQQEAEPAPAIGEPPRQEEEERWSMPKPTRGQVVVFYYRCQVSEKKANIGFVTHIGESQVSLTCANNGYGEVYHVDDPRVKDNPDIRGEIDGLWDFTDEFKQNQARFEAIEAALKKIQK